MGYAGLILGILTSFVVFARYKLQRKRQLQSGISSVVLMERNFLCRDKDCLGKDFLEA